MQQPRYTVAPYRMRNDDAWMVYDDRASRVVVLRLQKPHAETLAYLLNVANLDAPVKDYGPAQRPRAKRRASSRSRRDSLREARDS